MGFSTGVSIISLALGIVAAPLTADAQPAGKSSAWGPRSAQSSP